MNTNSVSGEERRCLWFLFEGENLCDSFFFFHCLSLCLHVFIFLAASEKPVYDCLQEGVCISISAEDRLGEQS